MYELIYQFSKNVIILSGADAFKMFLLYGAWFLIAEFLIYSLEKVFVGKALSVQWYDVALLVLFIIMYVINIQTLLVILKQNI